MPLNIRVERGVTVLSNFGRLMNDPRHFDAAGEVADRMDLGEREFVMEMSGVHETGASFLGLLMTITRDVRRRGGEVVIARPSPAIRGLVLDMRLDDFWDVFDTLDEAVAFYRRHDDPEVE